MPNFIPHSDGKFLNWSNIFLANLQPSLERFEFPPATYELLIALKNTFSSKLDTATNPMTRNKGTVAEKDVARKAFEKELRLAIRRFLTPNPDVTSKDREDLGLPVPDTTHTPIAVPSTRPEFDIEVVDVRRLSVHFKDRWSDSKARPYGVIGAVILYDLLPSPPTEPTDLLRHALATRTPFKIEFAGHERGQTVYFALCWQNAKGQRGPWSEIASAIVP
jgi:hypothetical protein